MEISAVSDEVIREEYTRRFTLRAGDILSSADRIVDHLRSFFTKDPFREKFVVVFLNGRNAHIDTMVHIDTKVLFEGTLTTSAVYPREVIRKSIKLNAAAIVVAHNHPSGNTKPSEDDITITKKLKEACSTVDIALHDHIIVAGDGYYSFADHGLI